MVIKNKRHWPTGNEPVLKYLLYSLSFPLCFIKSIINGLLKEIYSKDIHSRHRTACHLFTCANEVKAFNVPRKRREWKIKRSQWISFYQPQLHRSSATMRVAVIPSLQKNMALLTDCIQLFKWTLHTEKCSTGAFLDTKMSKYLSAGNVQLIPRCFLFFFSFFVLLCCTFLFLRHIYILMIEELSTAKTDGGFAQRNRFFPDCRQHG